MKIKIIRDIQFRSEKKCTPKEIIIHHTWGYSVDRAIKDLKAQGYSTHYIIDRDGTVYQVGLEQERMAHCIDHNWCGIGIDIVRGKGQQILEDQYAALRILVKEIAERYKMTLKLHKSGVFFHRDLRPTECPGEFDERALQF